MVDVAGRAKLRRARTPLVPYSRLAVASSVLAVAQLVHGLVPTAEELDGGGPVGFYGGILLLIGSLVVAVAAALRLSWAPPLGLAVGLTVAVGFALYHAIPVASPVTNPYPGEPVGLPAWLTVVGAVGAGAWCAYEARRTQSHGAPAA